MKNYFFSVLIPVYNVEKYLMQCLDSVVNQTYKHFEVIIIDDGSTDSSGRICDEYMLKDSRIKVYHQENQGALFSRCYGIKKSEGDYLLFLDSDDYWDEDLLETINDTINKYDCDLVLFKYKRVYPGYTIIKDSIFKDGSVFESCTKDEIVKKLISGTDLNSMCMKVVKRSVFQLDDTDYSYYANILVGEDLLQSIPLLFNANKIVYIDKALYNYRMHDNNTCYKFYHDLFICGDGRERLLDYLRIYSYDTKENLKIFYTYYYKILASQISQIMKRVKGYRNKVQLLNRLHETRLCKSANGYIRTNNYSLSTKVRYILFNQRKYFILYLFEKIHSILQKVYSLCKSRSRRGN